MNQPHARSRNILVAGTAAAVVAIALLASCAPAGAATARHARATARHHVAASTTPAAPPVAQGAQGAQGMVMGIDPETGRLGMPSREDMLQLSPPERIGLLRSSAGLVAVRLPDGSVMMNLQGRFMDYSVVRLDATGRAHLGCVDDVDGLARWFGACAPAPASTPALEVK